MTSQFRNGFTATLANGLINVKHVGDGMYELWVGCNDNPKPYKFVLNSNDLEVLANNLLDIVKQNKVI